MALKHDLVKKNSLLQIKSAKDYGISIVSTTLNMFSKESLKKVIPYCKKNKLIVWGRMPLAKGLLSGKYKSIYELGTKDLRFVKEKQISKKIIDFATKNKMNTIKALQWSENFSDSVVIGFKDLKQLKEILKKNG